MTRAPGQEAITRRAFDALVADRGLSPAQISTAALAALREGLKAAPPGSAPSHPYTAREHFCLSAGLGLELLKRPGVWNESSGDLVPFIVQSAGWPPGRALRIVDSDSGAIHLFRPGRPGQSHFPGGPVLPDVQDNEVILLRHARHFDLIRRDRDPIIDPVPANGDCFFSCISKALGRTGIAVSNLALRHALVDYLWTRTDAVQVAALANDAPRGQDAAPATVPAGYVLENGAIIPVPDYPMGDDPKAPGPAASGPSMAQRAATRAPADSGRDIAVVAPDDPRAAPRNGDAVVAQVVAMYHEEMRRHVTGRVLPPSLLAAVHQQLAEPLMKHVAGLLDAEHDERMQQRIVNAFEQAFKLHQKGNAEAAGYRRAAIDKAINAACSGYHDHVETMLAAASGASDETPLSIRNAKIQDQLIAELEHALRVIAPDEPLAGHLQAARYRLETYWRSVNA